MTADTDLAALEKARAKGNEHYKAGRFQDAIAEYSKVIEQAGDAEACKECKAKALNNRALCYYKLNDFEESMKDSEHALGVQPFFPKAWYVKAQSLRGLGLLKDAVEAYSMCLLQDPSNAEAKLQQELTQLELQRRTRSESVVDNGAPHPPDGDLHHPTPAEADSREVAPSRHTVRVKFSDHNPRPKAAAPSTHFAKNAMGSTGQLTSVPTGSLAELIPPDVDVEESNSGDAASPPPRISRSRPPPLKQLQDIERLRSQGLRKGYKRGDYWYLLDMNWWRTWQAFIASKLKSTDNLADAATALHPGPIDNTALIVNPNGLSPAEFGPVLDTPLTAVEVASKFIVKPEIQEGNEFVCLPEDAFLALQQWYGGGPCLPRAPVAHGDSISLDIYSLNPPSMADVLPTLTSRTTRLRSTDNLSPRGNNKSSTDLAGEAMVYASVASKSRTTCECCGGMASLRCKKCSAAYYCSKNCQVAHWKYHRVGCGKELVPIARRGKVGLYNLGNTCYLNSALHCMSHMAPITKYFLSNQYVNDLNLNNPLGSGGVIAREYDAILKDLWLGSSRAISPIPLKRAIGRVKEDFAGFMQHDAQEFLSYLLDIIHEDVNLVKSKPFVEMPESDGTRDVEVARVTWEKHQMRNRSIVQDHVEGMFRSACTCPSCGRMSVVFNPFSVINLDMPRQNERTVNVIFVPQASLEGGELPRPVRYAVRVDRLGKVSDLRAEIAKLLEVPSEDVLLLTTHLGRITALLHDNSPMMKVSTQVDVFAYHVPRTAKELVVLLNRVVYQASTADSRGGTAPTKTYDLIGFPIFVTFENLNTVQFRELAWQQVRRFVNENAVLEGFSNEEGELVLPMRLTTETGRGTMSPLRKQQIRAGSAIQEMETEYGSPFPFDSSVDTAQFCGVDEETIGFVSVDWPASQLGKLIDKNELRAVEFHPSCQANASNDRTVTLDQCFQLFTQEEKLDEDNAWYCSKCKAHQQASKSLQLWRLPNVLILCLKRFDFRNPLQREKIDVLVDFPIDGLDLRPYCAPNSDTNGSTVYDLFAVCNHYGRMGFGHYTAFARDWKDDTLDTTWYHYDDEVCEEIPERLVKSPAAYILFYKRRNT